MEDSTFPSDDYAFSQEDSAFPSRKIVHEIPQKDDIISPILPEKTDQKTKSHIPFSSSPNSRRVGSKQLKEKVRREA